MNFKIKFNNINKFPFINWKNVENTTWEHLEQFYSKSSKLKTNIFSNEVVSKLNINESGFKIINKEYCLNVSYSEVDKENIEELIVIKSINKGVEGIFKMLYLEVLSEIVTCCNEKNKIRKFKLGEKWMWQEAKEKAKEFCDFLLIKGHALLKNNKLNTQDKPLVVFIEPLVRLNLLDYDRILFSTKRDFNNLLSIYFLFDEISELNKKIQSDKVYDFTKIASIFLPKDALFIKKLPIYIDFDFQKNNEIKTFFNTQWAIKLVSDNVYLFY